MVSYMEDTKRAALRDKLDIAHALMEADHQRCNRLVLQMIELSDIPNMRFEIFAELVGELKVYALSHYAREESFMEISDYPGIVEHQREHSQQIEEISRVAEAVEKRDQPGVRQLTLAIFNSWQKHRDEHDYKLGDFLHILER